MAGKIEKLIEDINSSGRGVFMALIDPNKQSAQDAAKTAKIMEEGGADIILLGGSIGAAGPQLDGTAKAVRKVTSLPINIFPGNVSNITNHADSIYFMSLLNSRNPYWIAGAQCLGAPLIKTMNIECLPTAYLVFEPGQTVGVVGEANLLPKDKPDLAVAYCLAAEYLGMRFVILESGSGAPESVPPEIVRAVKKSCNLKIMVAGGIKTPAQARALVEAGASGIHIGTCLEGDCDGLLEKTKDFERAIHLR